MQVEVVLGIKDQAKSRINASCTMRSSKDTKMRSLYTFILNWDCLLRSLYQKVKEAAQRALEKYKQEHPDVDEASIKVDLPLPPPPQAGPGLPFALPHLPHMDIYGAYAQRGGALNNHIQVLHQQLQRVGQEMEVNLQEVMGARINAVGNAARAYQAMQPPAAPVVPAAAAAAVGPQQLLNAYQVHRHAQLAVPRGDGMRRYPSRNQPTFVRNPSR